MTDDLAGYTEHLRLLMESELADLRRPRYSPLASVLRRPLPGPDHEAEERDRRAWIDGLRQRWGLVTIGYDDVLRDEPPWPRLPEGFTAELVSERLIERHDDRWRGRIKRDA